MRTMSAETEPRVCEEDFGSDEGDVESYLEEEDNSSELLDRLKELEAENSALMLANESQREAYERCLDEVANHVVQALLNQKDLREECIKLKMLVFDLERQNRALCELFQQKLPSQSPAPYQVQPGPLPEYKSQLYNDSAKQVETALTEAQAKGNAFRPQHASPGPRGPAASMEALSPFFKKKAHILEVLRKMEETDPLKFHPSSAGLSFCDYSQALMSSEAVLAGGELSVPCKSQLAHCRCSCSEADKQPHVNGEVASVTCEGCRTCSASCRKSVESPAKCNHVCSPAKAGIAQIHTTAPSECHINSTTVEAGLPVKQPSAKEHQQPGGPYLSITSTDPNTAHPSSEDCHVVSGSKVTDTDDAQNPEEDDLQGGHCDEAPPLHPIPGDNSTIQMTYCEMETRVLTHNILLTSSDACSSALREASVPEKDGSDQEASCGRANALVSPSPSCLSEVKAAAISSPSKLLKFLKIPSIGERTQSSSPVRLSPQLTRTSRIPCRTNNYEVYHSPVPTRRATTTERCRQPPPPPARSESYPATHSAPTSPPQAEEPCPPPGNSSLPSPKVSRASRLGPAAPSTSASSPRAFQRVPHYENVPELSASSQQRGLGSSDSRTTLPSQTRPSGGDRKLVKSLPEGSIVGTPYQHPSSSSSSSSSTDSSSEPDVDVESTAWHSQHSLPNSSGLHRPQVSHSVNYTRTQNRALDTEERDSIIVNPSISQAPLPPKRNDPSSIPKRPGTVRQPVESSHHTFKDRLAALGKLRSSEDLQVGLQSNDTMLSNESSVVCGDERSRIAEKPLDHHVEEQKHLKHTDCLDGRPKGHFPGGGLKLPGASLSHDSGAKLLPSGPSGAKPEHDVVSSRVAVAKTDSPKSKLGLLSPNTDTPQVLRNNMKCPGSLNLSYNSKPGPGSHSSVGPSPSKVPPKSPSKPCQTPAVRMGKPSEAPHYSSKSEERSKIGGNKKKNLTYGDSLPPPPPRPPTDTGEKPPPVPSPQSAIEQKVMKGIEENMLKEQDRGAQPPEVKQKASNGIASWFALKKSKLPALSRKAEGPKTKEEKREWKINIPSVGKDSKVATRCKEGVEGLNISTLMEKAEGLRRALEEERAYVERSGRGHSCEVVMDQAQGQLAVMYRGGRSDNFMQQLLNRVDGKDVVPSFPQRRLSFDCKTSRPVFNQQSDGSITHTTSREDMEKGSDLMSNVTSDEILADPVHSQHFASSGASTYTLDSGIGTFPLPDYSSGAAGRSLSKARAGADSQAVGSPGRANRRSRTLDRDMSTLEECYPAHRQLIPTIQYGSGLEGKSPSLMQTAGVIHEDKETYGAHMFTPRSKTWTFPSLKNPAGSADVYLAVEEEEEPAPYGSPFRGSVKTCGPAASRAAIDPSSLPVPAQTGLSRRGKTRTPSVPEMSREAGLELLRERPEEALSPSRPQVLETPESLSDSLYDSLSSCGSQG